MNEKLTPFEVLIVLFLRRNHPDKRSILEVRNFVQVLLGLMMDERAILRQLADKQMVEEERLASGAFLYLLTKQGLAFPIHPADIQETMDWALANGAKERFLSLFFETIKGHEA